VTVIDGATDSVITNIAVGVYPFALVHNAINNKIYCANPGSDNVTVIDGATDTVITNIAVGDGPFALVHNIVNNKVYCANNSSGDVTVFDGATDTVITILEVGSDPAFLLYNAINNKVYCVNWGSWDVTVIDGATNQVIKTIAVGNQPRAMAWNPAQNRMYVSNYWCSSVSVIRDRVGIEEDYKSDIAHPILEIYPNPAIAFFTIRSAAGVRGVKIYDVLGKLVRNAYVSGMTNERTIMLMQMSAGIYFVKVNTGAGEFIRKFILTK
jgi:YVTN family beta-propeller protein